MIKGNEEQKKLLFFFLSSFARIIKTLIILIVSVFSLRFSLIVTIRTSNRSLFRNEAIDRQTNCSSRCFLFLDSHINGYLLLNSAVIQSKGLSSLIGLRFSIRSLNIQLQLQSLSKHPIEIRYRTRRSFNHTDSSRM